MSRANLGIVRWYLLSFRVGFLGDLPAYVDLLTLAYRQSYVRALARCRACVPFSVTAGFFYPWSGGLGQNVPQKVQGFCRSPPTSSIISTLSSNRQQATALLFYNLLVPMLHTQHSH